MNQITVNKFPLVENMQAGGNFVSKLGAAMIAADPVNFSRLCDAFPEIVGKFSGDSQVTYSWIDCRRLNEIADSMPEPKDRDATGRVWWGVPDRADEYTGEAYNAAWHLQQHPFHGVTCWMPASDLRAPFIAAPEDTYRGEG
jgi:hypothetical protein